MTKLKIAYFGTPAFSASLLESLLSDNSLPAEVVLAATQPDKPVGRKMTLTPSPVKETAQKYGIPVWDKIEESGFMEQLRLADLAIVFAYGFRQLIPLDYLKAPKIKIGETGVGFVNIHPSLLPRYRGSSPIAYPVLLGEKLTGVSLFAMDEKMDHGPVILQETREIKSGETRPELESALAQLGLEMAKQLINELAAGKSLRPQPQDHTLATRAPFMKKEDGFLPYPVLAKMLKNEAVTLQELPHIIRTYGEKYPFAIGGGLEKYAEESARTLYDFYRGMTPWPGIWTLLRPEDFGTSEGRAATDQPKRLKITGMEFRNGTLSFTRVQLEGKKEVDFATFRKAYNLF